MKLKTEFCCILLIFFTSCNGRNFKLEDSYIVSYLENGTDSTFKKVYFPNKNKSLYQTQSKYFNAAVNTFFYYFDDDKKAIREVKTYMDGELYGNYFQFYPGGRLKIFRFYVGNSANYSMSREYSDEGMLLSENGSPFVDYIINDRKEIVAFFSTTFYDSVSVEISAKGTQPKNFVLEKSSLLPKVSECRIALDDSIFFLKIFSSESGLKEKRIYYDTLRIKN